MLIQKTTSTKGVFLTLFLLAFMVGTASGLTVTMTAGEISMPMPDGTPVPMWGYGLNGGPVKVPGDPIVVPPGEPLTIMLTNDLPEPTSLQILGQRLSNNSGPVFTDGLSATPLPGNQRGSNLTARVRSFSHETAPGQSGMYTWSNLKPGTYLLQSGTNPAKQVQMGLCAAVTIDETAAIPGSAPSEAYAGVPYDQELVLLFHEVDPVIHEAIAGGYYGANAGPAPVGLKVIPSSVFHEPKYFLINGKGYPDAALNPVFAANAGRRLLVRFINAGLITHVPTFPGMYMTLVAEDGNKYLYTKEQYGMELPPAKRIDAILVAEAGRYPLYDARLKLSNAGSYAAANPGEPAGGGMLAYLDVTATAGAPVALPDSYPTTPPFNEDSGPLVVAPPGVLGNDTGTGTLTAVLGNSVSNGSLAFNADGSFTYTPNLNFNGTDSFTYRATNGTLFSTPATVTIAVEAVNDAPVAVDDPSAATLAGVPVVINVLANDTDVDGDTLTVSSVTQGGSGTATVNPDNTVTYTPTPGFTGTVTFTYTASDGTVDSNSAAVTVVVNAPVNASPTAVDDSVTIVRNTPSVTINVVLNDTDSDGTINPASVVITRPPRRGTAVNNGDGTVTWTPGKANFTGRDDFQYTVRDNLGAVSNVATVFIYVVK